MLSRQSWIAGFLGVNPPVEQTIDYFRNEAPEVLLPKHCVEFDILTKFHLELGTRKCAAGDVIEL